MATGHENDAHAETPAAGDVDTLAAPARAPELGDLDTMPGDTAKAGPTRDGRPPKIGRFDVLRVLGQGGMGRVYTAYDEALDRRVAIKVLRRDVGEQSRQRIEREAKSMAKLTHPNVVQVYEVGEDAGELFIAMEFVKGVPLDVWQAEQGRKWRDVLAAYRQAGEGLAAAHAVGLVHRDFKPQNAMVERDDDGQLRVRVLDFGLARQAGELSTDADGAAGTTGTDDLALTATGSLLGTPAYMAPEQFERSDVGEAADQFGFCVALWEGLYGERPFDAPSLPALVHAVTSGELREPPKNSPVPAWVRDTVRRGLALDPEQRWPSMRELLVQLRSDPVARRRRWIATGVGVVLVAGAGAIGQRQFVSAQQLCPDPARLLEGIWDDAARQAAEATVLATELPFAAAAWRRTAPQLDAYAQRWTTMHAETCEATEVRGEQSPEVMHLRMACLQRARMTLQATTALMVDADADVVSRLDPLVEGLADLDRCADAAALQHEVQPPPPAEAKTVEQTRSLLAQARAQWEAARYDQATRTTEQAFALIEDVSYPPIHTEVALERAYNLQALGDAEATAEAYRSAILYAAQSGQQEILHTAIVRLMYVLAFELKRPDEALALRELNLGLAARLGDEARAWSISTMGVVLDAKGEHEAAIAEHQEALQLWQATFGPDDDRTLMARDQLGHALAAMGSHEQAQAILRETARLRADKQGADHPTVATARTRIAKALMLAEQYAEAETEYRGAIELIRRVLGPDHTAVGRWRNDLADALLAQGKLDEAHTEYQLALQAQTKIYGADHPNVERSRQGLAKVQSARASRDQAPAQ